MPVEERKVNDSDQELPPEPVLDPVPEQELKSPDPQDPFSPEIFSNEQPGETDAAPVTTAPIELPDIPDLPEQTIEEARETLVPENPSTEEPAEKFEKDKASSEEVPLPQLPDKETEELAPPEYLEEETPYVHEIAEPEQTEIYVDAVQFYQSIQEIKVMKKEVRLRDSSIKTLNELSNLREKELNDILSSVDALQEDLIKIDSTLFE